MSQMPYAYRKRWNHDARHGNYRTVDAAEARNHVASLIGAGMTQRSIAAEAGVSAQVPGNLLRGQRNLRKVTADAVLAVTPRVASKASKQTTEPFVPRVGTVRRIQAMLALGWTHAHISAAAGLPGSAVVLHQQGRWVTRTTHDKVATAYRALSGRSGPSDATRSRAAKRGYLSPAHWDDIDLDIEPDHGPLAAELDQRTRWAEKKRRQRAAA